MKNSELKQHVVEVASQQFKGLKYNVNEGSKNIRLTSNFVQITFSKNSLQHQFVIPQLGNTKQIITVDHSLNKDVIDSIFMQIKIVLQDWYTCCTMNINQIVCNLHVVNWHDAPYWANYYAMDGNGECTWFEDEPTVVEYEDMGQPSFYWWFVDKDNNPKEHTDVPFFEQAIPYKNVDNTIVYKRPENLF